MSAANFNEAAVATDFGQYAGLRAAAQRNDPKALQQTAKQFESLFTEMILKSAHQTKLGDNLTGEQGDMYQDMFDQQMAMHLSAGKGLGLADMLVRQLNKQPGGVGQAAAAAQASVASGAATSSAAGAAGGVGTNSHAAMPANPAQTKSAKDFVDAIRPHAEKAAAQLGIPARALIAQAALETGWGQHMSSHAGNGSSSGVNLFGVKAQVGWSGASQTHQTAEFRNGQWTSERASFRSYSSISDSFDGYVQFLKTNPRYADALRSGDVQGYAQGLQKAGYATDPQYAQKLMRVAYGTQMAGAYSAHSSVST